VSAASERAKAARMASLVRLRAVQEQRAVAELAATRRSLQTVGGVLDDRRRAYDARPVPTGRLGVEGLRAFVLAGVGAHEAVLTAAGEVDDAEAHVEQAAAHHREARSALQRTERLEERARAAARLAERRAADRTLDELAVQSRRRRRPEDAP